MRRRFVQSAGVTVACLAAASGARANGFDMASNGAEQISRGGAWVARATDPMAVYYNPAALSRNANQVLLSGSFYGQNNCFDRRYAGNSKVVTGDKADQTYGQVCNTNKIFPDPQFGVQYRINEKLGIGLLFMGPATVGNFDYPETASNPRLTGGGTVSGPSGTRYMLTSTAVQFLEPQIGAGYEVLPNLRFGASFIWGLAFLRLGNDSMSLAGAQTVDPKTGRLTEPGGGIFDIGASAKAKDLFVPGFVLSGMYSPTENIDVAAWYHWSDAIRASGTTTLTSGVIASSSLPTPSTLVTAAQPMEVQVGFRYYAPRAGVTTPEGAMKVKDPLHDELFDVEIDGSWSHDSQFDKIGIQFNGSTMDRMTPLGPLPQRADNLHNWKDSYHVNIGGDFNVLPDQLALRAGAWYRTALVNARDALIDYAPGASFGLSGGGTYRVGPVDVLAGFTHIFFVPLDNRGDGSVKALTGTPPYMSPFAINGGRLTANTNIINAGVAYRWQ